MESTIRKQQLPANGISYTIINEQLNIRQYSSQCELEEHSLTECQMLRGCEFKLSIVANLSEKKSQNVLHNF